MLAAKQLKVALQVSFTFISLGASISASAQSTQKCIAADLVKLRKYVGPDLSLNGGLVLDLLEKSENGTYSCEQTTTPIIKNDVELMTCGFTSPVEDQALTIRTTDGTTWTLHVRKDNVSCGGEGYWLTDIESSNGHLLQHLRKDADTISVQFANDSCLIPSDVKAIRYSYKVIGGGLVKVTKLLAVSNSSTCQGQNSFGPILDLSLSALGLGADDLRNLK